MSTQNDEMWKELNFEKTPITCEDERLKASFSLLENSPKENDLKKHVKKIVEIYESGVSEATTEANIAEAKNLLLNFFSRFAGKKNFKKFLQDVISIYDLSTSIIKSTAEEIVSSINIDRICDIRYCTDLLNFVYHIQTTLCFEYDATIEYLFPFYCILLEGFIYHSQFNFEKLQVPLGELFAMMNIVFKNILTIFVKNIPYLKVVSETYSARLIVLAHFTILNEKIGFDIKTKAGLIITHSFNIIPEEFLETIEYKECPALDLVGDYNKNEIFTFNGCELQVLKKVEDMVIIYSSITSVYSKDKLFGVKIRDKPIICVMYHNIMECASSQTSIPHVIVEISRTLATNSAQLKFVPKELITPIFLEGINFVWNHIEHFVDTVRTYVRTFFEELVALAGFYKKNGEKWLADSLLIDVRQIHNKQPIRYFAIENMAVHIGSQYLLEKFVNLPQDFLNIVIEPSITDQVCKTYIKIMEKDFVENERSAWVSTWVSPVVAVLSSCAYCTTFALKIISVAFQLHPPVLRKVFPNDWVGNPQECTVLLKCLQYARIKGIELTVDEHEEGVLYWRGLIDKEKLEMFMIHQNDDIRVAVLAALVVSQKTTEIFLDWELNYLITYIGYNITPNSAGIRKQILILYKKAVARFNAGFHVIIRNIGILNKRPVKTRTREDLTIMTIYQELHKSYKTFILKFTQLLASYLTYDSNYPRRATSLELLLMIHAFLPKNEWLACWSDDHIKNVHTILFDGYESNKKMAVMLLKLLPPKSYGFSNAEFTFKYMHRCINMAQEIKPSKTLSAAYLLEICAYSPYFYDVIRTGKEDVDLRKEDNPILDMIVLLTDKLVSQTNVDHEYHDPKVSNYGLMLSIRHMLRNRNMTKNNEAFSGIFEHLTKVCLDLKNSIMPIVCDPSPEGYLPEPDPHDISCDAEEDEASQSQLIVVFSWRSIKEMTLLLAEIIRQTIKLENTFQMLAEDLMMRVGHFFISIFLESKHKGVFENAYHSFAVICESFWISSNAKMNILPMIWLFDAIRYCVGEKKSDKLFSTRRSAGLPFLILAIIGSEPVCNKSRFNDVMKLLFRSCENTETSNIEYRIHSLNVLRATFRTAKLGELVAPYISSGVMAAINGFKSDDWGVRNSSTILLCALITRMFGVQRTQDSEDLSVKNKLTIRIFFLRFPELFQFLLKLLEEECDKCNTLTLHPVLIILTRLYPSPFEEYDSQMGKYLEHLTVCLANPVYRTRELAARATLPFIETNQICDQLGNIFAKIKEEKVKDNECHGLLLKVLCILRANNLTDIPLTKYIESSIHIVQYAGSLYSHMTAALYMETLVVFLMKYATYDDLDMLKIIVKTISNKLLFNEPPVTAMSKLGQSRLMLLLYIVINKFEECDLTYPTVTYQILGELYGSNTESQRFCLNLLIYLHQVKSDYKQALYQTEDMEIPQEIVVWVRCFEKSSIRKILTNLHQNLKCFLMQEIKCQRHIKKENQVLLFLLINYYPCAITHLNLSKQETLKTLLHFCNCDNEELISAVLSCISTFLLQLDYNVLQYDELVQVLAESASPAASNFRRLAVCDFLLKNYILYCNEEPILLGDDLQMVFSIVMVLLEDDDLLVRNTMSNFASLLKVKTLLSDDSKQFISSQRWPVVPEKAREDLISLSTVILPKDRAICLLFSWINRNFPDTLNDTSVVFERGELNLYAENIPLLEFCGNLLREFLWTLEDGLNYEDRSIFIEEHTLLVTTVLLDAIQKHPSPMMLCRTKVSVICALRSTVKFLERIEINNNFVQEFQKYMNETILTYLTKHVEHDDLFSVKWVLRCIYDPVLGSKAEPS